MKNTISLSQYAVVQSNNSIRAYLLPASAFLSGGYENHSGLGLTLEADRKSAVGFKDQPQTLPPDSRQQKIYQFSSSCSHRRHRRIDTVPVLVCSSLLLFLSVVIPVAALVVVAALLSLR